jgi:hypothetical protein
MLRKITLKIANKNFVLYEFHCCALQNIVIFTLVCCISMRILLLLFTVKWKTVIGLLYNTYIKQYHTLKRMHLTCTGWVKPPTTCVYSLLKYIDPSET